MIDLKVNAKSRKNNINRCIEKNIIYPTYGQMKDPLKIPSSIVEHLTNVGLWDVNPLNLFRKVSAEDSAELILLNCRKS